MSDAENKKPVRRGGFEDDDMPTCLTPCLHPEHNPPMHLYIPQGQRYRHICPACGNEVVIRPSLILCKT